MRIELTAVSFSMSSLAICNRQLLSTHANLCSHTVKNLLQDRILQT